MKFYVPLLLLAATCVPRVCAEAEPASILDELTLIGKTLTEDVSVTGQLLLQIDPLGVTKPVLNVGTYRLSVTGALVYTPPLLAPLLGKTFTIQGTTGSVLANKIVVNNGGTLAISTRLQQVQEGGAGMVVQLGTGVLAYTGNQGTSAVKTVVIQTLTGSTGSKLTIAGTGGAASKSGFSVTDDSGFQGSYDIGAGATFAVGAKATGGAGVTVGNKATLVWGTVSSSASSADLSKTLHLAAGVQSLTLDTQGNNVTFSQALDATAVTKGVTYTKQGSGMLTLKQAATMKGSLIIGAGAVTLGAADAGGRSTVSGSIVIGSEAGASPARLVLAGADALGTLAGSRVESVGIRPGGVVNLGGLTQTFRNVSLQLDGGLVEGGILSMSGGETIVHATADATVSCGLRLDQVQSGAGAAAGSLGNGNILNVDADATLLISGAVTTGANNAVGLYKTGEGTLVLQNGNNTYDASTRVQQGTLRLDAGATLGSQAQTAVVHDGAVLQIVSSTLGNALRAQNAAGAVVATLGARDGNAAGRYVNVDVGSGGIDAAAAGRAKLHNVSLDIQGDYRVNNTDLVDTLVGLQSGASLRLNDVSFNENSGIRLGAGASGVLDGAGALTVGSACLPTGLTTVEYDGKTYVTLTTGQLAGVSMAATATLTLDVTNDVLCSSIFRGQSYLALTLDGLVSAEGTGAGNFNLADHLTGGFAGAVPSIAGVENSLSGGTVVYIQFSPAAMPEPAAATLSLLGAALLLGRRRRIKPSLQVRNSSM